jgi:Macrocin-O-methyltransferase (TylF)
MRGTLIWSGGRSFDPPQCQNGGRSFRKQLVEIRDCPHQSLAKLRFRLPPQNGLRLGNVWPALPRVVGRQRFESDLRFEDLVAGLAKNLGLNNVKILQGIFPDDTGNVVGQNTFCLCHIDVDVYQSAKDVVNWVWPRLRVGGVIVFDDYGFHHCQGITQLVDELAEKNDNLMLNNLNGHAVLVRRE